MPQSTRYILSFIGVLIVLKLLSNGALDPDHWVIQSPTVPPTEQIK